LKGSQCGLQVGGVGLEIVEGTGDAGLQLGWLCARWAGSRDLESLLDTAVPVRLHLRSYLVDCRHFAVCREVEVLRRVAMRRFRILCVDPLDQGLD